MQELEASGGASVNRNIVIFAQPVYQSNSTVLSHFQLVLQVFGDTAE
jgi:hypothetical protein